MKGIFINHRFAFILAFFFFGMHLSAAMAATYYVDNAVAISGSGASWAAAWKNFSDINWGSISAGDTIYISGGSTSKTYNEMLDIAADGTQASPIVITKGTDPGHNGDVILDGQLSLSYGVRIENDDYITVSGLHVRNYTGNGQIRVRYSQGALVENNDLYVTGHGGVYVHNNNNAIVRNNVMTTPAFIAAQTDGIYSQLNTGNIYEFNEIVISNDEPNGHDDGIQLYRDTDTTIRYNYIEQDNNKTSNAQGIYATESYGTILAYGNVVYGPNTWNGLLKLRIIAEGDAKLIAYQNTLVGGGWGTLCIENAPNSIVHNNILVNYKTGGWVMRLLAGGPHPAPANIDYNLYYAPNSAIVSTYEGTGKTWSEWKGYGYEVNGLNLDPLLKDVLMDDFSVSAGSPAIDSGLNLGSPYDIDKDGVSRPQGGGWDMGAYEAITNQNPQLAAIGNRNVTVGQTLTIILSANDPDATDTLTFTKNQGTMGTLIGSTFSCTPQHNEIGGHQVTFTVSDDGTPPLSDFETITITVTDGSASSESSGGSGGGSCFISACYLSFDGSKPQEIVVWLKEHIGY